LKDSFVLQIGDLAASAGLALSTGESPIEIEDLVPLPICVEAARKYAREICGVSEHDCQAINQAAIQEQLKNTPKVFDAVAACFNDLSKDGLHIEKVGFARNVIEIVTTSGPAKTEELGASITAFEGNMKILFTRLNEIRRDAERELISERVTHKINRLKKSFLQDHPSTAKRENAHVLFEDMVLSLDDGPESDPVRLAIMALRRLHEIDDDMTQPIKDYEKFKEGLELIRYAGRIATQERSSEQSSSAEPNVTGEPMAPATAEAAAG
jgi:hypothetical protein